MRILFVILTVTVLAACGSQTRIAVQNNASVDTAINVRNANNESGTELDFGDVKEGTTTRCQDADFPSWLGINVNAGNQAQSGTVDIDEGKENLIVIGEKGTKPAVEVKEGLCD